MTFDDFVRTHHHEPSYQELQALVQQAQQEQRDQQELAREQIRDIRIALGEETEKPDPKLAKTCTHLRENGQYCDSIAVKDRDFCKFHLHHRGRRLKMARARARQQRWRLQLPPLEDLYAVHVGIGLVLDALLHDQLDPRVGRLVLSGLRLAGANLARPDEAWEQSSRFQSREQLALPGFEAEFGLPAGFDLNTPPEVAFPETPAQRAAEGASGAVSEERANLMEVTSLDIELMELQQREGPEAVARRLKQAEQAEHRRYKKAQAQLAHARYVVRAAAQNAAREAQFVVRSEAAGAEEKVWLRRPPGKSKEQGLRIRQLRRQPGTRREQLHPQWLRREQGKRLGQLRRERRVPRPCPLRLRTGWELDRQGARNRERRVPRRCPLRLRTGWDRAVQQPGLADLSPSKSNGYV